MKKDILVDNESKEIIKDKLLLSQKMLEEYNRALNAGGLVTKTDVNGIITFVSDRFSELSGYSKEELIGKSHNILRHPSIQDTVFKDMWTTILNKHIWSGVIKNLNRNGELLYAHSTIIPIMDTNDEIIEFIAMRHDVSELVSSRKVFQSSYKIDMLTGLGNRVKLYKDLETYAAPILSLLNIRHFKEMNNEYGVHFGDKVLEHIASLLEKYCTKNAIEVYHLNGDEFALLCDQSKIEISTFQDILLQLSRLIEETEHVVDGLSQQIKIYNGISLSTNNPLLYADIALQKAKNNNSIFTISDDSSNAWIEHKNGLLWKNKIIEGIKEDRFTPFYQPIVNNITGKIESYETLIRLIDGETIISPFKFLSIAKHFNLYSELTKIMISKTFECFSENEMKFSLNLDIEDIQNEDTMHYFKNMLYKHSGIQKRLTIELVESEGIENFAEVNDFINEIKKLGCRVAIDDFGTGYSNYEYLMKLNIDVIKIDGSLIQGMNDNENNYNVLEGIVQMARKNKLKTVAEFVSSAELYDKVKALGIDYSQGYYIKEPSADVE